MSTTTPPLGDTADSRSELGGDKPVGSDRIHKVWDRPGIVTRRGIALTVLAAGVFVVVAAQALAIRSPLGHDESVYALRSRDLLDGWSALSGDYWRDYRAPGLPLMLSGLGRVVGVHVTTARALVVLLAVGILVSTVYLGVRLKSWTVGVVGAALLVVTYGFVLTSTTLLADTPGATFALVAVAIYLKEMDDQRLRWSFLIVPLATFVSTLSRFGAPFMTGAGLLAVAAISGHSIVRRRDWKLVAQSVALAVSVIVVAGIVVLTDTFSLFGDSPADANSRQAAKNEFTVWTGLSDLENVINPWSGHYFPMFSKAVGVLFFVGILASVGAAIAERSRRRPVVFGLVAGIVSLSAVVATVGLVVPNYLMLTIPYWAIAAATGLDWAVRTPLSWMQRRGWSTGGWALAAAGVAFVLLAVDVGSDVRAAHRGYETSYSNIRAASIVTRDALGDSCVLISRYTPQSGYYSQCRIAQFQAWDLEDPTESLAVTVDSVVDRWELGVPPDAPIAVMLVERAIRQPELTALTDQADLFEERLFEAGSRGQFRRHLVVETVAPCVSMRTCASFEQPG